jgi:tetratricopeptide (TPR) repeat protein
MGDASNIGDRGGDARRFAAFISYSHADADAAAKLQRRLERYRLPKRIVDVRSNNGTQIGAIFRDREDLAAAASLSLAIRDAIGCAEALVVMCSRDAAASRWVAAEIELFRELHPDKPILAALLSGEPAASFPAALTTNGNEPLAADLRPDGDGEQLGFLKIVAGIAGVPLDALIQRDAQRRIRRVTAITASALSAMLIMGIMTGYAISARNEATRQRAAAEGLVEYMLTDLRRKLRGVGRLDVMNGVNERAMAYYGNAKSIVGLSDSSLQRRSRILHAMGEDDLQSGAFGEALGKFTEAHRTTAEIVRKNPTSTTAIFAHSQSEYWLGYAAFRADQHDKTIRHFRAYKDHADRLLALEPDNTEWQREAGYANGNLCSHYLTDPVDAASAVHYCKLALANVRKYVALEQRSPSSRLDLANRYAWSSDALFAAGNVRQAWAFREQQQVLLGELRAADPKNADYELHWVQIQIAVAKFPQVQTDRRLSVKRYYDASTILDQLIAADPSNQDTLSYRSKLRAAYEFLN